MGPRVYNKRTDTIPEDAVYVGRPTKWGNPFRIGRHGTRTEVIKAFREWLDESGYNGSVVDTRELRGKDLVCWCAPLPCHADVLLELANQ
ncbi:hypothetical protein LCGC14_1282480 [marine sediment metagenome]|uniref:DUF4326 domain-containing protein n=1 Tax=marine sediment metagenome TaxID=412755 RepID=A0A0F9NXW6_9ZZZZ